MKLKTVTYSITIDTYNKYDNNSTRSDKIELTVELDDDDNKGENLILVAEELRERCIECLDETTKQKEEYRRELEQMIDRLLFGLKEAKKEWDEAQRFLVAQGLRENIPDFPICDRIIKKLQEAGDETF